MANNNVVGTQPPDEFNFPFIYFIALVVQSLRVMYSTNHESRPPGLRHIDWAPDAGVDGGDPESGTIVIDDIEKWNPSRIGSGPAIYVRGNDLGILKLGLAGNQHIGEGYSDITGKKLFTKTVAGSLSVFCLSRLPAECRMLSFDVAMNLQQFSPSIRERAKLSAMEVSKVQAPRPLKEKPDHLASIVTVDFGSFATWYLTPIAPKLTDIQFRPAGTGLR